MSFSNWTEKQERILYEAARNNAVAVIFAGEFPEAKLVEDTIIQLEQEYHICRSLGELEYYCSVLEEDEQSYRYYEIPVWFANIAQTTGSYETAMKVVKNKHPEFEEVPKDGS